MGLLYRDKITIQSFAGYLSMEIGNRRRLGL